MPDISKEHNLDFEDRFKKDTAERDQPSLQFSLEVIPLVFFLFLYMLLCLSFLPL